MVLACDAGGTKTNLALVERSATGMRVSLCESFRSRDYASLVDIVAAFTSFYRHPVSAAAFAVAGPVVGGRLRATNLPWLVDAEELAQVIGLGRVSLLNDLEAQAWSVLTLGAIAQQTLQPGVPDEGTRAVIAAGTGLGFSALVHGPGRPHALASEGGHADFSPGTDEEIDLLRALRPEFGRVSAERVVSGPGLFRIYEFLRARDRAVPLDDLDAALAQADPSAAVARAAQEGRSIVAERAALLFLGAYGAEAGNWALRTMATAGVWLGGGVARKLMVGPPGTSDRWRRRARAAFLDRFCDKGRLSGLMRLLPVHLILSDEAPLIGAAHYALVDAGV